MGGLIRFMPFTYTVMLIGTIALLGLPWLSGFYSKDLILELAYGNYQFSSIFAFILGTLTAFLTAFYSFRLINLVYFTVPNANKISYLNIPSNFPRSDSTMTENYTVLIPLSILALFAIFLGFTASDFVGMGSDFFGNSLFYHPTHIQIIEAEFSLPLYIKLMPTFLSLLGGGFAIYLYHYGNKFLSDLTFPFLTKENRATLSSLPRYAGQSKAIPLVRESLAKPQGEASKALEFIFNKSSLNTVTINSDTKPITEAHSDISAIFVPKQPKTGELDLKYNDLYRSALERRVLSFNSASELQRSAMHPYGSLRQRGKVALQMQTFIINGYTFLNGKYLLDILYNTYLISVGLKLGYQISKLLDKGIIELIGPFGLTEGSYSASTSLSKLDTGVITTYALYISLGLISILFILFFPILYSTLNANINETSSMFVQKDITTINIEDTLSYLTHNDSSSNLGLGSSLNTEGGVAE